MGNFGEGFVEFRPEDALDFLGMRRVAHNSFVQVAGELGLFGLIVYICLILSGFLSLFFIKGAYIKKSKTAKDKKILSSDIVLFSDALMLSLVGFCVSGFFLSRAYEWTLYYIFAFIVILGQLSKKELETDE